MFTPSKNSDKFDIDSASDLQLERLYEQIIGMREKYDKWEDEFRFHCDSGGELKVCCFDTYKTLLIEASKAFTGYEVLKSYYFKFELHESEKFDNEDALLALTDLLKRFPAILEKMQKLLKEFEDEQDTVLGAAKIEAVRSLALIMMIEANQNGFAPDNIQLNLHGSILRGFSELYNDVKEAAYLTEKTYKPNDFDQIDIGFHVPRLEDKSVKEKAERMKNRRKAMKKKRNAKKKGNLKVTVH